MKKSKPPLVSEALVEHLKKNIPRKLYAPNMKCCEVFYDEGKQFVVEAITRMYAEQESR